MNQKITNLGTMLSKAQAKKIIGGLVYSPYNCLNICYSDADCPYGHMCNTIVCPDDITKFSTACFRS